MELIAYGLFIIVLASPFFVIAAMPPPLWPASQGSLQE
jgi:hypothetical protein